MCYNLYNINPEAENMKTATATDGTITATVNYEQTMEDVIVYADGANVKTGEKLHTDITMTLTKGDLEMFCRDTSFFYNVEGKTGVPKGAKARFSDGYIGAAAADLVTQALEEARADMIQEPVPSVPEVRVQRGAGYCDACESYCFGDCQSN